MGRNKESNDCKHASTAFRRSESRTNAVDCGCRCMKPIRSQFPSRFPASASVLTIDNFSDWSTILALPYPVHASLILRTVDRIRYRMHFVNGSIFS